MNEYEQLREAYKPDFRCADCPDEDAFEIRQIEVSFAIPVVVTQDQSRQLVKVIDDITKSPWNQPLAGVHWLSGMGSKPLWREPEEPDFDDSIYFLETCAREFVSFRERERKIQQRAEPSEDDKPNRETLLHRELEAERFRLSCLKQNNDMLRDALQRIASVCQKEPSISSHRRDLWDAAELARATLSSIDVDLRQARRESESPIPESLPAGKEEHRGS